MNDWRIFKGTREPHDDIETKLPEPPGWRTFTDMHRSKRSRGEVFQAEPHEIELINAALYLRRPLLITGKPGNGKSSLAYAVAYELKLGPVLSWPITTRSTLAEGLYRYDAIRRVEDASMRRSAAVNASTEEAVPDIGRYLRLGPLGTALLPNRRPRVLLIDEIDKSDIDLPNDLLNTFEEGEFEIPELARLFQESGQGNKQGSKPVKVMPYDGKNDSDRVPIEHGRVRCDAFPFVVLTSNGEREFPPAFLRRCLRLDMQFPNPEKLAKIVEAHLGPDILAQSETQRLIEDFLDRRERADLATDQLLNAVYLASCGVNLYDKEKLIDAVLEYLTTHS
jgi:MoxR-like ATPase